MHPPGRGAKQKNLRSSKGRMVCKCKLRSPPQLWNHLSHTGHCTASRCSETGFYLSARHYAFSCHFLCYRSVRNLGIAPSCLLDLYAALCGWCLHESLCRCHATLPFMLLPCHTMRLQWCASPSDHCVLHPSITSTDLLWDGVQVANWTGCFLVLGIQARCLSNSSRWLQTFSDTVAVSPHCRLRLSNVMCW